MEHTFDPLHTFILALRQRWKREWTLCLVIFLTLRLAASYLGYMLHPDQLRAFVERRQSTLLQQDQFSILFINVWKRWDTDWYLKIAAFGYDRTDGTASYLPLYPWLSARLGALTGNYLLSALLISIFRLAVFILL